MRRLVGGSVFVRVVYCRSLRLRRGEQRSGAGQSIFHLHLLGGRAFRCLRGNSS
jgi:hypothetical protein